MDRQLKRYKPEEDYFGGSPIKKTKPDGTVLDIGITKPRSHFNAIKRAQGSVRRNYEDFMRECMDRNVNSNPNLPYKVDEYAYKEIPVPYDPNAPKERTFWERLWDWLPSLPTQREYEKQRQQYPWLYPPPWFPVPVRP